MALNLRTITGFTGPNCSECALRAGATPGESIKRLAAPWFLRRNSRLGRDNKRKQHATCQTLAAVARPFGSLDFTSGHRFDGDLLCAEDG